MYIRKRCIGTDRISGGSGRECSQLAHEYKKSVWAQNLKLYSVNNCRVEHKFVVYTYIVMTVYTIYVFVNKTFHATMGTRAEFKRALGL